MYYLVYEQDPFVRADICEALSAEFEGQEVAEYETLVAFEEGLTAHSHRLSQLSVIFVISTDESEEELQCLAGIPTVGRLVIVTDEEQNDIPENRDAIYLSKPFSAHGLIAAIRDGLSDRPASPTQTPE